MPKIFHDDDAKAIAIPRVFPKTSELMKAECLPNLGMEFYRYVLRQAVI